MQVAAGFRPAHPREFVYKIIDVLDMPFVNLQKHFQEAIKFMKDALSQGGAILVHCYAGVSRSATCVAAYLMQEMGMSFINAMNHLRRRRPIVYPNFGF